MKMIVVLTALIAVTAALPADTYDQKYDNFDIKGLVKNDDELVNYLECFLDEKPCSPEPAKLKKVLHEALITQCAKCTPKQREILREATHAFQEKQPELWNRLLKKVDPKGEFKVGFD